MPFQVMSCDFLKNHRLKRNQEGKRAASVTSVDVAPCSPGMAPFMTSTETNRPFDRKDVTNVPSPLMWGCLENTEKQPCFIIFRLIYSSTSAVLCINSELAFHFPQGCSLSRRRVSKLGDRGPWNPWCSFFGYKPPACSSFQTKESLQDTSWFRTVK